MESMKESIEEETKKQAKTMTAEVVSTAAEVAKTAEESGYDLWKVVGGSALVSTALLGTLFYLKVRAVDHDNIPMVEEVPCDPVLGHGKWLLQAARDKADHDRYSPIIVKRHDERGKDMHCLSLPGSKFIITITDPKIIKFVFTDEFNRFDKGDEVKDVFAPLLGDGIFMSDGQQWTMHRKIASRFFSMRNLRDYMFDCAHTASLRVMAKLHELNREPGHSVVDMNDMLGRFTLDSFVEISFGDSLKIIETAPNQHPFSTSFDRLTYLISERVLEPYVWWKIKRAFNFGTERQIAEDIRVCDKFVDALLNIETRQRRLMDETGRNAFDVVSLYLREYGNKTKTQLKYIAFNMIIAGRDTTRLLLSWFLYVMTTETEVYKKVLAEFEQLYKKSDKFDYRDVNEKLKYTTAALLESLRLYPSVPFSWRYAKESVKLPNGYVVHSNDQLICDNWSQARLKSVYGEDAAVYNPMRFYEKGINTFPPEVYPHFHQPPRMCLGRHFALLEAKIFLYYFFKEFRYQRAGPNKHREPRKGDGALLQMVDGFPVTLTTVSK